MRTLAKAVIGAVIIFPLAFTSGVILQKRYVRLFTHPVSPCTLNNYRAIYQTLRGNSVVNVKCYLYGGEIPRVVSDAEILHITDKDLTTCADSLLAIEVPQDDKVALASRDVINKLRRLSIADKVARAEFEVIGKLEPINDDDLGAQHIIKVYQLRALGTLENS